MATVNHFPATCIIPWVSHRGTRKIESLVVLNSSMPHKRAVKLNANLTARYQSTGRHCETRCGNIVR